MSRALEPPSIVKITRGPDSPRKLLTAGIDVDELRKSILMKIVRYPGQVMEIDHSLDEARHAHESLIKSAYARLFD